MPGISRTLATGLPEGWADCSGGDLAAAPVDIDDDDDDADAAVDFSADVDAVVTDEADCVDLEVFGANAIAEATGLCFDSSFPA